MFEIQRKVVSSPNGDIGAIEMKSRSKTTPVSEMGLRQSARGGMADADGRRVNPYNYARNILHVDREPRSLRVHITLSRVFGFYY